MAKFEDFRFAVKRHRTHRRLIRTGLPTHFMGHKLRWQDYVVGLNMPAYEIACFFNNYDATFLSDCVWLTFDGCRWDFHEVTRTYSELAPIDLITDFVVSDNSMDLLETFLHVEEFTSNMERVYRELAGKSSIKV